MKVVTVLDSFISNDVIENSTINMIDKLKSINCDILLVSAGKVSEKVQSKVDYMLYDSRNQLFKEDYDNYKFLSYYTVNSSFKVSNVFSHPQPHGLSVLMAMEHAGTKSFWGCVIQLLRQLRYVQIDGLLALKIVLQ